MNTLPDTAERPVVLVVDDEPEILVALTDLLDQTYHVLAASSGEEGLALLRQHPDVAVIISDQRMPGMTGDVFFAHARELSGAGAILLTGYADISAVEAALNRGQISFFAYKPWDDETLLSMVGQAADRYRLENELARERLLLRGLLENLPFGLAFKDQNGSFIRLNQQMAREFNRNVVDCLGYQEEDLVEGARLESLRQAQGDLAASGRDQQVLQLPGPDGQTRWHDLTRVRLDSLRNEPLRAHRLSAYSILIDRDVTELLSLEQRLQQAQKMQAIGTLAGGIAHDFNNLLTAILGSLELVQDLDPPREAAASRLYQNAMQAARRGAVLTRRLLDFSRPRNLVCQQVDVAETLENLRDFLMRGKVPEDILAELDTDRFKPGSGWERVSFELPDIVLPPVWTDATQLQLAVLNQCLNALEAQPQGNSSCVVSVRLADKLLGRHLGGEHASAWVVVQIRDHGTGMTEEQRARIFEPFFTTRDVGQGNGLGLSMTYSFISHCGGEVRVEGIPGGGTAVELWFPTMAREKVQAEPAQTRAPVRKVLSVQDESAGEAMPEVAATSFGDSAVRAFTLSTPVAQTMARVLPDAAEGHTILVVDDEPGVRAVTAGFLRRAGYAVLESSSGLDALEAVQQYADIALVVMDVKMPGMNGGEAARHIHARRPELPVLFVTGYADFGLLPEGVAVLHKPYTRDALLGDVRAMLAA